MYKNCKYYWTRDEGTITDRRGGEKKPRLLKEYLDALKESKPNWKALIKVHGIEVIRCAAEKLDYEMLAGNLLYSSVGLATVDYPSQTYIYYVD